MDKDLFERIVGTVVRNAATPAITYLVAKGWVAASDGAQLLTVGAVTLAAVIWGIVNKYKAIALTKLALKMPENTSLNQLKEVAKSQKP